MLAKYQATNNLDANNRPAGGTVEGTGLLIEWQNGPLGAPDSPTRLEPNGAFVETVIDAARQRIAHYQSTQFACVENHFALAKLEEALWWLDQRTKKRTAKNIEGTHAV